MEGPSPTDGVPDPKASLPAKVQNAPSTTAPASPPEDCHGDLCHWGVLLLPQGQQVEHVGHHGIEEGHHKGHDQQKDFLLPSGTALCLLLLLNLVGRYWGECTAVGSQLWSPWGEQQTPGQEQSCSGSVPASLPSIPALSLQPQGRDPR